MSDPVREHGFSALPRNINVILGGKRANTEPRPMFVGDVNLPDSAVANKVHEYAKQELGQETYNHSMRVYFFSEETYFLTYMLHDIGSTSKNLPATLMSFEFYGAYLALELLYRDLQAPKEQAEAVVAEERTTIIVTHSLFPRADRSRLLSSIKTLESQARSRPLSS